MAKRNEYLDVVELRARIAEQGLDRAKFQSLMTKIEVLSNTGFSAKIANQKVAAIEHFLWAGVRAGIYETVPGEPVRFRVTPMGQVVGDIWEAEEAGIDVFGENSGNGVQVDG